MITNITSLKLLKKKISFKPQDKDKKIIESQLKIGFKVNENKKIIDKINNKEFDKKKMLDCLKK